MRSDSTGVSPREAGYLTELAPALASGQLRGISPRAKATALVGSGESYAAWLVHDDEKQVLLRVACRHPDEMPCAISAEFAALRQVPSDIGTHGIAYDESEDNVLSRAYVVSTYVPGAVRPAESWTPQDVSDHARQLARFHHHVGTTTAPAVPASEEAVAGLVWWTQARPDIVADPRVQLLLDPWLRFIQERDDAWAGMTQHRLIHSDLVVTNIVIAEDRTPRYIDWEWGAPGDVAKDLALFGGSVHGGPWYVALDDEGLTQLVTEYITARAELGDAVDRDRLMTQRDAWEVTERLLGCLHFLTRAQTDPSYRQATDKILAGLARRLGQSTA